MSESAQAWLIGGDMVPRGADLAPTASQKIILRRLYVELDVPSGERLNPGTRFDAQQLIQKTLARCLERREHLYQEQMKDIRPSPRQVRELEALWEALSVPESRRRIPDTKEAANTVRFYLESEAEQRGIDHRVWNRDRNLYESTQGETRRPAAPPLPPIPGRR